MPALPKHENSARFVAEKIKTTTDMLLARIQIKNKWRKTTQDTQLKSNLQQ